MGNLRPALGDDAMARVAAENRSSRNRCGGIWLFAVPCLEIKHAAVKTALATVLQRTPGFNKV